MHTAHARRQSGVCRVQEGAPAWHNGAAYAAGSEASTGVETPTTPTQVQDWCRHDRLIRQVRIQFTLLSRMIHGHVGFSVPMLTSPPSCQSKGF